MEIPEYTDAMHAFVNQTVKEIEATLLVGTAAKFPDLPHAERLGLMATVLSFVVERLGLPLAALVEVIDE